MLFNDAPGEHRMAGVSLRYGMHQRVRRVTCAFASERSCAPGRWIHEEGARCDEVPERQQSRIAHTGFHTLARVIAISITQGNAPGLTTHLDRLRRACDGKLFRTMARHDGNTVAIGVKQGTAPGWFDLHARAEAVTKSIGLDLYRHVRKMERHHRTETVPGYASSSTLTVEQDVGRQRRQR